MSVQLDQLPETRSAAQTAAAVPAAGWVPPAVAATEPALPTRRRQRTRNTRRPPSGLVPVAPALVGVAGCDLESDAGTPPYRMGRWARLAITLTVVSAVLVIALTLVLPDSPVGTGSVTVATGDTLWNIAQRIAPDSDTWAVVDEITALNGLTSNVILPGQTLMVPLG